MRNTNKQKGFTLIELLVVIAIIGLLASVVLLALNSARQKSRDAKRVADIRQIMTGLELYFNDCNSYPIVGPITLSSTYKLFNGSAASCGTNTATAGSGVNGGIGDTAGGTTYISQMPSSPTPNDGACTVANNIYSYTGTASTYSIAFCLGAQTGGLQSGPRTASQGGIN